MSTSSYQSTLSLRIETKRPRFAPSSGGNFKPHHPCGWRQMILPRGPGRILFQSTPPLRVETANLYSDTQYFPYRFGEIHNFALSPPTFLSSQSTKTALWAIFLARSSRKFYDCLGFAPSSTYSIISPGWQSRIRQTVAILSHDTGSPCLIFCSVASPSSFSFLILYVVYPTDLRAASISILYLIGTQSPSSI